MWQKEFSALIEAESEAEAQDKFNEFNDNFTETQTKELTKIQVVQVPKTNLDVVQEAVESVKTS